MDYYQLCYYCIHLRDYEFYLTSWIYISSYILRKTIEGYLDSVPSLTFSTIKTLLIMHVFHNYRHLQSKWMPSFSHASMV